MLNLPSDMIVFYDADCGFCQRSVSWMQSRTALQPMSFVPYQSEGLAQRFSSMDWSQPPQGVQVLLANGSLFQKENAVAVCLKNLKGWAWLGSLILLIRPLSSWGYALIACHRYRISSWLGGNRCSMNRSS